MKLIIQNNSFNMHPSGALYFEAEQSLIIADVHLGKIEHFRKNGSAVPQILSQKNYIELDRVINKFKPQTLIFLGDLFHSDKNSDWQRFEAWVSKHAELNLQLVMGNHDIISTREIQALGITTSAEVILQNFKLTHHPETSDHYFNICGHIHPGYFLRGQARQSFKLSCFFQKPKQLILPAFGAFTGKHLIKSEENDQVYVIADQKVYKIP